MNITSKFRIAIVALIPALLAAVFYAVTSINENQHSTATSASNNTTLSVDSSSLTPTPTPKLEGGAQSHVSGKGVLYYTENYIKNFSLHNNSSNYDLPIDKSQYPNAYSNLQQMMLPGNDCSRYTDLTEVEIEHFKDLNLDYVILGFGPASWYNIATERPKNPTNPNDPAYDFTNLDRWIKTLNSHNIKVVLQLWGTPTWASDAKSPRPVRTDSQIQDCQQNPYNHESGSPTYFFEPYNAKPKDLNDYADFVEAVAKRYKDVVKVYSLWSRPNITAYWKGSIDEFIKLNNEAYKRIKSIKSELEVWGGNFFTSYSSNQNNIKQLLEKLHNNNFQFDILSAHIYPYDNNRPPSGKYNADSNNISLDNSFKIFEFMDSYGTDSVLNGKKIAVTETGFRSNWEHQFPLKSNAIKTSTTQKIKSYHLSEALYQLNLVNESTYTDRVVGVANSSLYNSLRWWSTGLINYNDNDQLAYRSKTRSYFIYKNWDLNSQGTGNVRIPQNEKQVTIDSNAIVYTSLNGGLDVLSNKKIYRRSYNDENWIERSFEEFIRLSNNYREVDIPTDTNKIDTAYYDNDGAYILISDDQIWLRNSNTDDWSFSTLKNFFYTSPNAKDVEIPTEDIDTAYYDYNGGYTVIKDDISWYREDINSEWTKQSLKALFYTSKNAADIKIPTGNIDNAYYDQLNGYVVIQGDDYWYRASLESNWIKMKLEEELYFL